MRGPDVCRVLRGKGVDRLHHANSVATSCTFLEAGGLASRGYVEDRGLTQTPQSSDAKDQEVGVWNDVFLDSVDIHHRANRRNLYGPVLVVADVGVLEHLPAGSDVLVTKKNPIYWADSEPEADRFFVRPEELEANFKRGTFGQMIVVRTRAGILPFPAGPVSVVLDDPQGNLANGRNALAWATRRLEAAARAGGTRIALEERVCRPGCRCVAGYAAFPDFDLFFQ